jgi:hypothetical protein
MMATRINSLSNLLKCRKSHRAIHPRKVLIYNTELNTHKRADFTYRIYRSRILYLPTRAKLGTEYRAVSLKLDLL